MHKKAPAISIILILALFAVSVAASSPLPAPRHIFINVANDAGVKWDWDGAYHGSGNNNTYYIKADGGGLNELHITNDLDVEKGQVTTSSNVSGVLYFTNTGGRGFDNEIILLVSVKGPIPDDFALHIRSSGYNWTPATSGPYTPGIPTDYYHIDGAVDETFTKDDFLYGPQTWKPGPGDLVVPSLPLYYGQDVSDGSTEEYLMFIDLYVGNMFPSKTGTTLIDNGAAKVEYSFTNMTTRAAFNGYGWCSAANQDQGISWTNQVSGTTASGYSVVYVPPAPVANFSAIPTSGYAPLTVQFTDQSSGNPTSWAWDFHNDGTIDSTARNPGFTYPSAGTYTVNLTATNSQGSDSEVKTGYITVNEAPEGPVAGFSGTPTSGDAPLTVQFTDESTGSPATWTWTFGDGESSDQKNPSHTYNSGGTYTVSLTVTGPGGSDSEEKSGYITVSESSGPTPLPDYNHIFVRVANDAGAKYNAFGNDTYNIRFEGVDRGLNALHISTDPAVNFGQVTVTDAQSGTFYATDSGGKGYEDEILLMVAVNGTIPDDFALRITSDGYTWTPNPVSNQPPTLDNVTYQPVALDETFGKDDFRYGPQIWKPTGNEVDYPIYAGQDMADTGNTFRLMFADLNAGVLRPNESLENQGAVRIRYSFEHLGSFAAFNVYAYCKDSNNGDDMVAWTNALLAPKAMSGYSVHSAVPPTAGFDADPTSGSAPLTVQFNDESTGTPTSWEWAFGDGTTSTEQNPSHIYSSEGSYDVSLVATNSAGADSEEKEGYITVTSALPDPPVVNFVGDNRTGPAPLTVHFTDQSTNSPTSWAWDFENDGVIDSTDQNPTHTYTTAGTFQVNLTASNAGGTGYRLKGNYIQVTGPVTGPDVDFSADSRMGTKPFTVHFTDLTVTDPTSWAWDFENDGIIDSTEQNPTHTYITAGIYAVGLTAGNDSGTGSRIKANYITVNSPPEPPDAAFTASPTSGNAPLSVQFTDQSTGAASWSWSFGDGSTSNLQNPSHSYSLAGTYTVQLIVTNTGGSDTEIKPEYITVTSPPEPPDAAFTASPTSGNAPLSVQFTDQSTGASSWSWSFGDGSTSTLQSPSHSYSAVGTYTVQLTVTNAGGSDHEIRPDYITVTSPGSLPTAEFTAIPRAGKSPLMVRFMDRSSGEITSWAWDFENDGTIDSRVRNPTWVYRRPGTYDVRLVVTGPEGSDEEIKEAFISANDGKYLPAIARFMQDRNLGSAPATIHFTDQSIYYPDTWFWSFGDGTTSSERDPEHTYSSPGLYHVRLTVSNEQGGSSSTGFVLVRNEG